MVYLTYDAHVLSFHICSVYRHGKIKWHSHGELQAASAVCGSCLPHPSWKRFACFSPKVETGVIISRKQSLQPVATPGIGGGFRVCPRSSTAAAGGEVVPNNNVLMRNPPPLLLSSSPSPRSPLPSHSPVPVSMLQPRAGPRLHPGLRVGLGTEPAAVAQAAVPLPATPPTVQLGERRGVVFRRQQRRRRRRWKAFILVLPLPLPLRLRV